ncbi:MAG: hypothetical protein BIFFINMI_02236 [Phycisphaerae bacterium]|nr:hypothetical protein [Phycisphaerae bacterium]
MKRLIALCLTLACLAGPALAVDRDVDYLREQAQTRQVIDRSLKCYVFIGGGSGAVISPDGLMITNNHVAGSAKTWKVKLVDGKTYVADLLGTAPETDLAVLKLRKAPEPMPYLPLADSDALEPGQRVIAIGNPFALGQMDHTPTVTLGVVSAVGIFRPNAGDAVVTDAPVNPGNSGGPLIDMDGRMVGVNGQIATRFGLRANSGTGYAISSNQVSRYVDALRNAKGGKVQAGALNGAAFTDDGKGDVAVGAVEPGSPADKAGLRAGDVLKAIANWPVPTRAHVFVLAARYPVGATAPLSVLRDGQRETLTVALAEPLRGAIGIVFESVSTTSLKIERVIAGGPADLAGLKPGDTVIGIGQLAMTNRRTLSTVLQRLQAGQTFPLTVRRDGKQVTVQITAVSIDAIKRLATEGPTTQPDDAHAATAAPVQAAAKPAPQPRPAAEAPRLSPPIEPREVAPDEDD